MATSKLQKKTAKLLNGYFGQFIIHENSRPVWCIGDTGERLELDFYIEELSVAVEVQGQQHYEYVPLFHGTPEGFVEQQKRDKAKKWCCKRMNVILYYVDDESDLLNTIEKIWGLVRSGRKRTVPTSEKYWNNVIDELIASLRLLKKEKNHHLVQGSGFADKVNRIEDKMKKMMHIYHESGASCIPDEKIETLARLYQKYRLKADDFKLRTFASRRARYNVNSANRRQAELLAQDNKNE